MAESRRETLELKRADGGHDLWAAVEAAQYARIVEHDPPRTDAEAAGMQDLVDFFTGCAEQWDTKSAADQTLALQQLGLHLATLDALGLHVYWAVIEGRFDTAGGGKARLPVAVLAIARGHSASVAVELPGSLGIG